MEYELLRLQQAIDDIKHRIEARKDMAREDEDYLLQRAFELVLEDIKEIVG